jgi:hypothetical protein
LSTTAPSLREVYTSKVAVSCVVPGFFTLFTENAKEDPEVTVDDKVTVASNLVELTMEQLTAVTAP